MRLAIVHFHLRKGGVTKVISSALQALGTSTEAVVLSSTESEEALGCPVAIIPELAYERKASREQADTLYRSLRTAAQEVFGSDPDVWHIHNHSLGKNVNFPEALRLLIEAGQRVVLQIHDFAEDGRPGNYADQMRPYQKGIFTDPDGALYPVASQIRYAVLNGRDRQALLNSGIPADRVVWLPNAVTTSSIQTEAEEAPSPDTRPLLLYPTRAIRRKNLGELLMLSAACPQFRYATTLSPKNPQWESIYRDWVEMGKDLSLPVEFALGEQSGQSFEGLISEAHAMITTSVGEGFGLAFLEPWLMGKPIIGRDLPEITADFKDNGISLPDLYPEWRIPFSLFDSEGLRQRYMARVFEVYRAYGREADSDLIENGWSTLTADDSIDAGYMDETAQAQSLKSICQNKDVVPAPLNPQMIDESVCPKNVEIIRQMYGLEHYGRQLNRLYTDLLESGIEDPTCMDTSRILDAFLKPESLRLLRT